MQDDGLGIEDGTVPQHDDGMHAFTPALVGYADDPAHLHLAQLRDHVLDFCRVDVLAAADDHVLDTVDHVEVAVGVHTTTIAGMHPSAFERRRRLGGLVPVPRHDRRPANGDLAHLARRAFAAVRV